MSERRLFSKKITESDAFLDMPLSSQALYFHMCMSADDDGFIGNPRRVKCMIGASEDDIRILVAKKFTIPFESGIMVIKHWFLHNALRKDRYKPTDYTDEKRLLYVKENGVYTLDASQGKPALESDWQPNGNQMATKWQPNGNQMATGGCRKISKDKISQDKLIERECAPTRETATIKTFVKPSIDEIKAYCEERHNGVNAERFYDFYESKGWKVGNQSMRDWRACVRTWEARDKKESAKSYTTEQLNSLFDNISEEEL